ncbi:hypothetical protein NVT87_09645 [Acinetobacter radioresistens]|jgi:hypothetical protein|uniref:hypothetical protein n=1 Tax=Acinetobacter TaxID=469 RepID=UPI0002EC0554|nr:MULTISPECIES: hypothetical protein [Acinetobacter]MCK4087625.1 hypothetical protein [Acinetobacter radioresistens]MCK4108765.1 hypothetical protein [Acinetobacter radioresistens]MCU4516889.1 hypothetical protein [Acinetobacter radioresistens]MCX0331144.1 hypothetical protein [Acinetobacter radioresistens]MDK8756405.1 hypothetical protein [Acinetobacter radioresistens]
MDTLNQPALCSYFTTFSSQLSMGEQWTISTQNLLISRADFPLYLYFYLMPLKQADLD